MGLTKYLRLPSLSDNFNLGNLNVLAMDSVKDKSFETMEELANNCFNYQCKEMKNFLKEKIMADLGKRI